VQFRASNSASVNENLRSIKLEIAVPGSTHAEISQKNEPGTLTIIKNSSNRTAVMASTSALDLRRSCRSQINRIFGNRSRRLLPIPSCAIARPLRSICRHPREQLSPGFISSNTELKRASVNSDIHLTPIFCFRFVDKDIAQVILIKCPDFRILVQVIKFQLLPILQ